MTWKNKRSTTAEFTRAEEKVRGGTRILALLILFLAISLLVPFPAAAYIGPGAGFAFVSSFLILLTSLIVGFLTLLTWPIRWLFLVLRGRRILSGARVRKVVVVGFDGQDPEITDRLLAGGALPNFARLRDRGGYVRLKTSLPAESPVAWSSFQTGSNPGKHRVFDFLVPNRKSYLSELCSARVEPARRTLKIGRYRVPLGRPRIRYDRKSRSFWSILGEHGIFSTILRVPVTFPAEKFHGALLSAMSAPDLLGTQGTFSYFTSDAEEQAERTGGRVLAVERHDGFWTASIPGPENTLVEGAPPLSLPLTVRRTDSDSECELIVGNERTPLRVREYTPWVTLDFKAGLGFKVRGLARFYLKALEPELRLYMTPIQIHPERPALPISHPFTYAVYLARTQGAFATAGLAEDTWALNEGILDEAAFLEQAYAIHEERERMFLDALRKTQRGAVVCVFDLTDRVQHMFWRYLDEAHPANRGRDQLQFRNTIDEMYERMDRLVGRVLDEIDDETALFVMSDHGFKSFRKGVNLNTWLHHHGFLAIKEGAPTGADYYRDVDWSNTRAWAAGIGGIYCNVRRRESQGIVSPGEELRALEQAIRAGLEALKDEDEPVVRKVYDTAEEYTGPYAAEGPDLIVGFAPGYRVSWECAVGVVANDVIVENRKPWSGDHCLNPADVPGVFFANRTIDRDAVDIMDVGPTILDLFGVPVPAHCDGQSIFPDLPQESTGQAKLGRAVSA